jgi:hypothetical protein
MKIEQKQIQKHKESAIYHSNNTHIIHIKIKKMAEIKSGQSLIQ